MTSRLKFGEAPFSKENAEELFKSHGRDSVYVYDIEGMIQTCRGFNKAFNWVPKINGKGYQNFFAVKSLPNPYILEILKQEGQGTDCSSGPELILSDRTGITGQDMMLTSNDTPWQEFARAMQLGAIINLDDIGHVSKLERVAKNISVNFPTTLSYRINPGDLKEGTNIIGNPKKGKYGVPIEKAKQAYELALSKGVKNLGMHTMVVSNERDEEYLIDTAKVLFKLAVDIFPKLGVPLDFINLGGGVGIQYHPKQSPPSIEKFSQGVKKHYDEILRPSGLEPRIVTECGRAITGPHGWLLTKVRHISEKYRWIVGVDACMADLMRPGMYTQLDEEGNVVNECYHHITVLGKEGKPNKFVCDIVGSLCEGIDKFAIQRAVPSLEEDDVLAIHTAGAHSWAMGFNYNAKLKCGETARNKYGDLIMIRRPQNMGDYFSTLNFPGSKYCDLSKLDYIY